MASAFARRRDGTGKLPHSAKDLGCGSQEKGQTQTSSWDLAGDASATEEHVNSPLPTGNTSPLPPLPKQEPPEALGAAGKRVHCFSPELGQLEPSDGEVAFNTHRYHLLQHGAACPCCPHHAPLSPTYCQLQLWSEQS